MRARSRSVGETAILRGNEMRRMSVCLSAIYSLALLGCGGEIGIEPVYPITVEVRPSAASAAVGDTLELTATVSGAPRGSMPTIRWASSNDAVAMVTQEGVVMARAVGMAVITATAAVGSRTAADAATVVISASSSAE